MICSKCGHENESEAVFCGICGAPLAETDAVSNCYQCGRENPIEGSFCVACGSPLTSVAREAQVPRRNEFKRALLWTAGSIMLASILSFGILTVPALLAVSVTAAVFYIKGNSTLASGIMAGMGVGLSIALLVFVMSCFALITGVNVL